MSKILTLYIYIPNDCESPSGSDNIETRVRARNEKARKKTVHKKSQHFTARNLGNTSSSELFSYEILNPKDTSINFTI